MSALGLALLAVSSELLPHPATTPATASTSTSASGRASLKARDMGLLSNAKRVKHCSVPDAGVTSACITMQCDAGDGGRPKLRLWSPGAETGRMCRPGADSYGAGGTREGGGPSARRPRQDPALERRRRRRVRGRASRPSPRRSGRQKPVVRSLNRSTELIGMSSSLLMLNLASIMPGSAGCVEDVMVSEAEAVVLADESPWRPDR